MATRIAQGFIWSIVLAWSSQPTQYSVKVHTDQGFFGMDSGGSKDWIYWRLCHDPNPDIAYCGVFQRSKWSKGGQTYSESYKVPQTLGNVTHVDIVNTGNDGLSLDWIEVDGYECSASSYYDQYWLVYKGTFSTGCGVITYHCGIVSTDPNYQSYDVCPYNLDKTYTPTTTPTKLTIAPTRAMEDPTNSPSVAPTGSPTNSPSRISFIAKIEEHKLQWHAIVFSSFAVVIVLAVFDAYCYRQNDYFKLNAFVKGLAGVLHVLTDLIFAWLITDKYHRDKSLWNSVFAIVAWITNILPVTLSVVQLCRMIQGDWSKREGVRQWLLQNSYILYILSVCCGNSFTAVGLVNCNAFRLKMFSMGLQRRDLSKFRSQRLSSVVIFEVL